MDSYTLDNMYGVILYSISECISYDTYAYMAMLNQGLPSHQDKLYIHYGSFQALYPQPSYF